MDIHPAGMQPSAKGRADWFTGIVRIDPLFDRSAPARVVVGFPPGERHWHGATPTTAMTRVAVQEKLDGQAVDGMEHVSDPQYRR